MSTISNVFMYGTGTGMGITVLRMMAKRKCKNPLAWALAGGLTLLESIGTIYSVSKLTKESKRKIDVKS